jgi:hypothetical protein
VIVPFAKDAATEMSTLVCCAAAVEAEAEKASANTVCNVVRTDRSFVGMG